MFRDIVLIGLFLILSVGIIISTSLRDEAIKPNKFDCQMLIGGWHPDVPIEIQQQCRKGVANDNSSKTSYR